MSKKKKLLLLIPIVLVLIAIAVFVIFFMGKGEKEENLEQAVALDIQMDAVTLCRINRVRSMDLKSIFLTEGDELTLVLNMLEDTKGKFVLQTDKNTIEAAPEETPEGEEAPPAPKNNVEESIFVGMYKGQGELMGMIEFLPDGRISYQGKYYQTEDAALSKSCLSLLNDLLAKKRG